MTDDLDDLLARIDSALDEEPPPDDEWEWSPDDEDDDPEPLRHPPRDTFDLMYAVAVIRGLVRPHRELTDAEEIAGREALADDPEMLIVMPSHMNYPTPDADRILIDCIAEDDYDPEVLEALLADENIDYPDSMEVEGTQGRLGFRWL